MHVHMQTIHNNAQAKAWKKRQELKDRLGLRSEWRRDEDGKWFLYEPKRMYMSSGVLGCTCCSTCGASSNSI